jgi:hypothetical protein
MLCPFTTLMSSPWKKSPNVRPRTENKAWIFVNSFSFIFYSFSRRFTGSTFSHGLRKQKRAVHRKPDWTGPRNRVGRSDRSDRSSGAPATVRLGFPPICSFSTSYFGQKILREVWIRKMRFLGFSFSDYLFGRIGSSGIHPI